MPVRTLSLPRALMRSLALSCALARAVAAARAPFDEAAIGEAAHPAGREAVGPAQEQVPQELGGGGDAVQHHAALELEVAREQSPAAAAGEQRFVNAVVHEHGGVVRHA